VNPHFKIGWLKMDKQKLTKLVDQLEQLNSNVYYVDQWVWGQMKNTISKIREEMEKEDAGFPESVKLRNKTLMR
jgi:hypothetical protein